MHIKRLFSLAKTLLQYPVVKGLDGANQGCSTSHGKDVECHHWGKDHYKHDYKWMKENGKIKKIGDSEEEMKDNQPKKSSVKIEELNVLTHDNDTGNDIMEGGSSKPALSFIFIISFLYSLSS